MVKLENERHNFGGLWHSDTTYLEIPPMGSMLLAREVPPYGGDTVFANQYMAYEALSDGLKATLDGLIGVSSSTKAEVSKTREDRLKAAGKETKPLTAEHPIVRTHPETGRKALYTSSAHTSHIKGWTERESLALLEFLWEHQVRPEFTCRFRWEPARSPSGTTAVRCTTPSTTITAIAGSCIASRWRGDKPQIVTSLSSPVIRGRVGRGRATERIDEILDLKLAHRSTGARPLLASPV